MKILIFIFSLLISMNLFAGDPDSHGNIVLTVDGFHNDEGTARLALFASSDGFPEQPEKAIQTLDAEIRDGKLEVSFVDVPYGVYAVSVLHDENRNGKMDTNWVGIPKEGYGASNDAKSSFGPPEFDDARFSLDAKDLQLHITVQY